MRYQTTDGYTVTRDPNIIHITTNLHTAIVQTEQKDWISFCNELRLNVQSRIAGTDERNLLKLQARLEYINELEAFFKDIVKPV